VADIALRGSLPGISSNFCSKHYYPSALALIGRALTIDQGPAFLVPAGGMQGQLRPQEKEGFA
jgi:hypothetical protein